MNSEIKNLSIDAYFMKMAINESFFSNCESRKVGAVITLNNSLLTTGYNAAPQGISPCIENGGCMRRKDNIPSGTRQEHCLAVHAEQNAIIMAAKKGISINGSTLYVTTYPCGICARMIINSGIRRIVYDGEYQDKLGYDLLSKTNIEVEKFDKEKCLKLNINI